MATCTQCGAPAKHNENLCSYCGTRLGAISETLGTLILGNIEAVKAQLAGGDNLGLQGRHLAPVAFKDLNSEYFMPIFERGDGGVVLARLAEEPKWRPTLKIDYQVLYPGEDPAGIVVELVREMVFAGEARQWFGGWRRCPFCSGKYHISRVLSGSEALLHAHDCPACRCRELMERYESTVYEAQRKLSAAEKAVPKKPGFFTGYEDRARYEKACKKVASCKAVAAEWADIGLGALLERAVALADQPLVGEESAAQRQQLMTEIDEVASRLGVPRETPARQIPPQGADRIRQRASQTTERRPR